MEWLMPKSEDVSASLDYYVVSFVPFHERELVSPPHHFFQGLPHHYRIELQHLNPNGIQHITAIVALCEGYLGIEPHFKLYRYLFRITPQKKREKGRADLSMPMGCTSIHLRSNRSSEYMSL
jgi:hypothetical protein